MAFHCLVASFTFELMTFPCLDTIRTCLANLEKDWPSLPHTV